MAPHLSLQQYDIVGWICSYLDLLDLVIADKLARLWRQAAARYWRNTYRNNNLTFKKNASRYHTLSDKCFALLSWQLSQRKDPDREMKLVIFGGTFGTFENRLATIDCRCHQGRLRISELVDASSSYHEQYDYAYDYGASAYVLGSRGTAYLIGGWKNNNLLGSISQSDFISGYSTPWTPIASATRFERCFSAATSSIGGDLFIMGGADFPFSGDTTRVFADAFWKRADDEDWLLVPLPDMTVPRCGHSAVTLLDDSVVVLGGYEGGRSYLDSVERFDLGRASWMRLPPMEVARSGLACGLGEGGCILVAGGSPDGLIGHRSAERLDPREGKWMKLPDMYHARGYTAGCVAGGGLFFVSGGLHNATFSDSIECFDSHAGQWLTHEEHPITGEGLSSQLSKAAHVMTFQWR